MANYSAIKAAVNAYIKANGKKEITGRILNSVLNATIDSLGKEFQFGGVLTPADDPGQPDQNVAYIGAAGTYSNFDNLVIESGNIGIFLWNGDWSFETIPVGKDYDNDIQSLTNGLQELSENIQELSDNVIHLDGINEEDLSIPEGGKLQFANRVYNAQQPNGMGYVILRKNKTFAEQVTEANTIYEIRYSFVLTDDFQIPSGCVLDFRGGSIDGAFTLDLNDCQIIGRGDWIGAGLNVSGASKNAYHLGWFGGNLGKAISCVPARATIIGGPLAISNTISISRNDLREVILDGFKFTLDADLFTTSAQYVQIPSFINCHFDGNGYAIFGGEYCIGGQMINCVFRETSLISGITKTLQSLYANGCSVKNDSVTFIKARRVYDCHISNFTCEGQSATFMDTHESDFSTGGTQQLWVSDSLFEGFSAAVFNLSGGNIRIRDSYFESNSLGCVIVSKGSSASDILSLEVSGCKFNSSVDSITITGFTDNFRVKISVHDNNFSGSGTLAKGIVKKDLFSFFNNRKSINSETLLDGTFPYYDAWTVDYPTVNTTYFTRTQGGFVHFGKLVIVEMRIKAVTAIASRLDNAVTNLPTSLNRSRIEFILTDGTVPEGRAIMAANATSLSVFGPTTVGSEYIVRFMYLSSSESSY